MTKYQELLEKLDNNSISSIDLNEIRKYIYNKDNTINTKLYKKIIKKGNLYRTIIEEIIIRSSDNIYFFNDTTNN